MVGTLILNEIPLLSLHRETAIALAYALPRFLLFLRQFIYGKRSAIVFKHQHRTRSHSFTLLYLKEISFRQGVLWRGSRRDDGYARAFYAQCHPNHAGDTRQEQCSYLARIELFV